MPHKPHNNAIISNSFINCSTATTSARKTAKMITRRKTAQPQSNSEQLSEETVPKGYVPVLVGSTDESSERVMVPVRLFNDPCILALLETVGQELGYRHQGMLRIPCDTDHLRMLIELVSKSK